jgi:hypothetical protein
MLESKFLSGVLSAVALLALSSCARDKLAPDCFEPDPDGSGCLIPNPGGSDVTGSCLEGDGAPPAGAVGAEYFYDLSDSASGGTNTYSNWMATTPLPPGLMLDPATGIISGIPEGPGNMAYPLSVSVDDALTGENYTIDCADIVINPRLNSNAVRLEPMHCIPHTATKAEMEALLEGGDGTEITCSPISDAGLPCPLGDGNGRPAPGITFDAATCTHSGSISGDRRGTWVWMVAITQSGFTTRVPFCATRDFDAFHDITLTANMAQESDLNPGLLEYDPSLPLDFGNAASNNMIDGTHVWDIEDPACNTDPSQCNSFGFEFNVTCSPFDPPFSLDAVSNGAGTGITHDLGATGPTPSASFADRPFVASFEMLYCTSNAGANCDVDDPNFEQNAQTQYHYDVVGFPVLGNP